LEIKQAQSEKDA